jgi:hypothetical protein
MGRASANRKHCKGNMKIKRQAALLTSLVLAPALAFGGCNILSPGADRNDDFEVWLVDQSDSQGRSFGGTIHIFDGAELGAAVPGTAGPAAVERVDLAAATSTLCTQRTGANPVRPHMLLFNDAHTHAILSFVASGHVVIYDAASRQPLDCFRTSQSPTGRQAHAAFPAPDGSFVIVANQNGKRLERIDTNFTTNTFSARPDATLDLATCTTPSGRPCESPDLRPINWPICPMIDASSRFVFVTLRGGGMLVVDARQTPMAIVAEYDFNTVKGNGCGGAQVGDRMYINSGGSPVNVSQGGHTDHPALFGFDVYRFPATGFSANNPPNTPAPEVLFSKSGAADSHGMVATGNGSYVWVFDRHGDVAEIISHRTGQRVGTVNLAGSLSDNPAPDLADLSPNGDQIFLALRGPTPLSGDPHNARGSTPGLGVIQLSRDGRTGQFSNVIRITNVGEDGIERADAHAVRVRLR